MAVHQSQRSNRRLYNVALMLPARYVALCYIFFLWTGLLLAVGLPAGEGFDEPSHLSYIHYVSSGFWPPARVPGLSGPVDAFLAVQPVGKALHELDPELKSHDEFWSQPEGERVRADAEARQLSPESSWPGRRAQLVQYETHQPPLYYLAASALNKLIPGTVSLSGSVILLRLLTLLIASAIVPLSAMLLRELDVPRTGAATALALTVVFPGIYPALIRVSNDALFAVLALALFIAIVRHSRSPSHGTRLRIAGLLLAGLLTKAFFIPIGGAVGLWLVARRDWMSLAWLATAAGPGSLWYFRNYWQTGSWTGLPETVGSHVTIQSTLAAAFAVDWWNVLKIALSSHIWTGNYSLLGYRSWMYEVVEVVLVAGVAAAVWRSRHARFAGLCPLLGVYGAFWIALGYYATQVFQSTGRGVIQGWYLAAWIPLEALAVALLLDRLPKPFDRVVPPVTVFAMLALFVYGNFFIAAPHYAGLTLHSLSGHLATYHPQSGDAWRIASALGRLQTWTHPVLLLIQASGVVVIGLALVATHAKVTGDRGPDSVRSG